MIFSFGALRSAIDRWISSANWIWHAALVLILGMAAYLRFRNLGDDSVWFDEAASWTQATSGGFLDVISATARDNLPPLHNVILWAEMAWLGESEWVMRFPSAVLGVLNVLAIYWVGGLVAGRKAGLIAAALLAFSAFHIWYSQEARPYALLAISATLFVGASLSWWGRPTPVKAALVALAGLALLYSHPYGAFTWLSISGAVTAMLVLRSEPGGFGPWRWVAVQLVIVAGFLPWALILLGRAKAINADEGFWIAYPTPEFVYQQLNALLSSRYLLLFAAIAAIAAFVVKARIADPGFVEAPAARDAAKPAPTSLLLVIVSWALGPILLGYLISVVSQPILIARYLIAVLPAILILAAVGLSRFASGWPRIAAVIVLTAGVSWVLGVGPPQRQDWRGASALVADVYRTGPICLVLTGPGIMMPLRYYFRQPVDCVTGAADAPSDRMLLLIATALSPRSAEAVAANMLRAFPRPAWQVVGTDLFRGIVVTAVSRAER
jgi:uncharacterized membrane protein